MATKKTMRPNERIFEIEGRLRDKWDLVVQIERFVDVANPDDDKDLFRVHLPYGFDRPFLDLSKSIQIRSAVGQIARQCGEYS